MDGGRGTSRPASAAAPRVSVALRWREPRTSLSLTSAVVVDKHDEIGVTQRNREGGTRPAATDALPSRLCVLRRRLPAHSGPSTVVVGLGMRAVGAASPSVRMEEAVQTPLLAVEGLEASDTAGAAEGARDGAFVHHGKTAMPGAPPASPSYTDANLMARLADIIAEELLPSRAPAAAPTPRPSSTTDSAAPSREVLAFTVGPQGSASTAFLFGGGALGWAAPVATPSPPLATPHHRGLLHAVLERVFAPDRAPRGTRAVAALSVTEVRDAAPLRHPSLLQRPRATVDLLSGAPLRTEGGDAGEHSGTRGDSGLDHDAAEDRPTDIPAACYVRVATAAEAMAVLYAALASSLGWTKVEGPPDASPPLLRPLDASLEERPCHVCVTLLVSCEPLSTPPHQRYVPQTHDAFQRSTNAGTGVWKLWDLASPSITCGYRPLAPAEDRGASTTAARPAPAAVALPWSSRYSLAALTQTCLVAAAAAPTSTPLLGCDRSAALPILASATDSCSLVVPVFTVVADAALDEVNAEVMRTAAAWSAYGRAERRSDAVSRLCGLENAEAAQRVVREYAVAFADFVSDLYPVHAPSSASPGDVEERQDRRGAAVRGESGVVPPLDAHDKSEASPLPALHTHSEVRAPATRHLASTHTDDCDAGAAALLKASGPAMQPLSINVTHNVDDAAEGDRGRAAPVPPDGGLSAVSALRPSSTEVALLSSSAAAGGDPCDGVVRARSPPAPPQPPTTLATAAQRAAAAAAHAEAARLQRFHALFETDSLFRDATTCLDVADTAHATAADERRGATSMTAAWTPLAKGGSPPSVLSTGRRPEAGEVRRTSLASAHGRSVDRSDGGEAAAAAASAGATADARREAGGASSGCPPQALQYDTRMTSAETAASAITGVAAEAARTDAPLTGADEAAGRRERADAAAALATFLAPYCDEFVRLYATMQADVRAWRAEEAATLAELSALAARHTRDVQDLAALQQRLVDGPAAAVSAQPADTALGLRTTDTDVGLSGVPGDAPARRSTLASTSALIFEQLVRSEEKVAWLERQLVEWRRRAHEASVLDPSSHLADTPDDHAGAAAGTGSSLVTSPKEDPATPHLQAAQALLGRLLQRCSRTYAAAQQRSDRWHDQLTHEQAAASALRQRVAELEAELAELRAGGGRSTPWGTATAHPGVAAVDATRAGLCEADKGIASASSGRPRTREVAATVSTPPPPPVDELEAAARSSLTAAPVSPIASDAASSLPSSLAASAARAQRHRVAGLGTETPRGEVLGRVPADSHDAHSWQEPMPSQRQQQQLAALLSRAVMGSGSEPCPDTAAVTGRASRGTRGRATVAPAPPLPVSSLFEVHVGTASADSRADAVSRSGSGDADFSDGAPQAASSTPRRWQQQEAEAEDRVRASLRSSHGAWHLVQATPTAHDAALQEVHGVADRAAGALTRRSAGDSYGVVMEGTRGGNGVDGDGYPSAALEALGQAAAQLERDAVRLGGISSAAVSSPSRAGAAAVSAASSRSQRLSGRGTAAWPAAAAAELQEAEVQRRATAAAAPLSESMSRLRAATQAVQREARDAAERERAYLSAVLFKEPHTPTIS